MKKILIPIAVILFIVSLCFIFITPPASDDKLIETEIKEAVVSKIETGKLEIIETPKTVYTTQPSDEVPTENTVPIRSYEELCQHYFSGQTRLLIALYQFRSRPESQQAFTLDNIEETFSRISQYLSLEENKNIPPHIALQSFTW